MLGEIYCALNCHYNFHKFLSMHLLTTTGVADVVLIVVLKIFPAPQRTCCHNDVLRAVLSLMTTIDHHMQPAC